MGCYAVAAMLEEPPSVSCRHQVESSAHRLYERLAGTRPGPPQERFELGKRFFYGVEMRLLIRTRNELPNLRPAIQVAHRGASSKRALRAVVGMDRSGPAGSERSAGCSGDHSLGSGLDDLRGWGALKSRRCARVGGEVRRSGTLSDRRGPQPLRDATLFTGLRGSRILRSSQQASVNGIML